MSIIILGGCGNVGRVMALDLVKSGFDITIADINEVVGKELDKKLGTRASFQKLDVHDFDMLVETLKNYKLAINNIGPYFEYEDWVPRAALEAGINYVDICDDFDAAEIILNMHERVEREGLVFRTGFGSSPGNTNIMARMGASKLDEVNSIRVFWFVDTGDEVSYGQLCHWTHIAMGKVPVFRDGKEKWVQALTEREIVQLPEPAGRLALYMTGHPEPITIPRYIETNEVICKGGTRPESDIDITRAIDKQLTFPLKDPLILNVICKLIIEIMPLFAGNVEERVVASANRVEVVGMKEGKDIRFIYGISGTVAPKTAIPTSVTAIMMLNEEIVTPGVFPPEGCPDLNVDKFVKELAKRNIKYSETKEAIKKIPV